MTYIPGLDRSHLNSRTPLANLTAKGVKFVWLKLSQGLTYKDPTFDDSWSEALKTPNLIRGAYHFFDPRVDGVEQAKWFLSHNVVWKNSGCLPPAVDVEDLVGKDAADALVQNKWVENNWKLAVERLQAFLGYVQSVTGKPCVIYSYNSYMRDTLQGTKFPNNPFWLSSLQVTPPTRYDTGKLPEFWQNTYRWQSSDQDGDYFTGTQDELNYLANIS